MRNRLTFMTVLAAASFVGVAPVYGNIVINPFFESTITGDANAASIEGTINSAIGFYEANISTNITVGIAFGEGGGLGESISYIAPSVAYSAYHGALIASSSGDATDTTALAGLPGGSTDPVDGGTAMTVKAANMAALGFSVPAFLDPCPGGTGGSGFDGCILVNTALTTPGSPGSSLQYSLLSVTEHEIDEILGLGSGLPNGGGAAGNPNPEDLFRYNGSGARTYSTNSETSESCTGASAAYFSLNGATDLAQFNNCNNGGDYGDWLSGIGPAKVQDAYGSPGTSPSLSSTSPEVVALDAIGYNLVSRTSAVPEPVSVVLLGSAMLLAGVFARRRLSAGR